MGTPRDRKMTMRRPGFGLGDVDEYGWETGKHSVGDAAGLGSPFTGESKSSSTGGSFDRWDRTF